MPSAPSSCTPVWVIAPTMAPEEAPLQSGCVHCSCVLDLLVTVKRPSMEEFVPPSTPIEAPFWISLRGAGVPEGVCGGMKVAVTRPAEQERLNCSTNDELQVMWPPPRCPPTPTRI